MSVGGYATARLVRANEESAEENMGAQWEGGQEYEMGEAEGGDGEQDERMGEEGAEGGQGELVQAQNGPETLVRAAHAEMRGEREADKDGEGGRLDKVQDCQIAVLQALRMKAGAYSFDSAVAPHDGHTNRCPRTG